MGVHNHEWSGGAYDARSFLRVFGPLTRIEVHVPSALATLLQQETRPIPAPAIGWALIDTGASSTCVDSSVIDELGVPLIGTASVGTAGGVQTQAVYPAGLRFPGMDDMHIEFSSVLGVTLKDQMTPTPEPLICLIGRDVLETSLLVYNGMTGAWTLARND